jgi:RNA polymerase sigma-70 factor (ECF subfamily)
VFTLYNESLRTQEGTLARLQSFEFQRIALEHLDALFGYAMTLTRDRTVAEDLVQETYLRAIRAADRLEPESNVKSWLFVIMRNAWLNEVRHDQAGPKFVELESETRLTADDRETMNSPHIIYLKNLARLQVQEAIERLPEAYREIIVLRDFEGLTYQEIATVLDCPAGTVMSRLGRARGKLRQLLSSWQPKRKVRSV